MMELVCIRVHPRLISRPLGLYHKRKGMTATDGKLLYELRRVFETRSAILRGLWRGHRVGGDAHRVSHRDLCSRLTTAAPVDARGSLAPESK